MAIHDEQIREDPRFRDSTKETKITLSTSYIIGQFIFKDSSLNAYEEGEPK